MIFSVIVVCLIVSNFDIAACALRTFRICGVRLENIPDFWGFKNAIAVALLEKELMGRNTRSYLKPVF